MNATTSEKNLTERIIASIPAANDSYRVQAVDALRRIGLPVNKAEEYKHTPLSRELERNFTFDAAAPASGIDPSGLFIPGLRANVLVFINGAYSEKHSSVSEGSDIRITALADALSSDAVAQQHFNKYVNNNGDGFTAWNTASWTSGVFIHVRAGKNPSLPVVFYHIADAAAEVVAINRNLIVVDESGELTVIEKYDSAGSGNHFLNLVNEVFVGANAGFNYYAIQNDRGNRFLYNQTEIFQLASSRVNTFTFSLEGRLIRNNLHLSLDGEGVDSHMYGLYLLTGGTLADNHTVVDHRKPNSFSNELYKGVMDGNSKGVFNGKIFVRPLAQKTNAFQANRNILLSDKASVNTKPQLEIWADDVKCSHGCTSGQLDEEALFYLRARGISADSARAMMLYAFAGEVVDKIRDAVLKEYLDGIISERLHKNF